MANPSASGLDRANACPASVVLPQVSSSSNAAERGTAGHQYIENKLHGLENPLENVPEQYHDWCLRIDTDALLADYDTVSAIEQPFAIDVTSSQVRRLDRRGHRNYAETASNEYYGTVDLIATLKSTRIPCVVDWKTGRYIDGIQDRMQLRFFATAVHLETGAPVVEGRYGYIDEDGGHSYDYATFTLLDFQETLGTLADLHARIAIARTVFENGGMPNVAAGDHCKYCPAFNSCPAKMGLVTRTMPGLETIASRLATMTPEDVGIAYAKFDEMSELMDKIGAILKERAHQSDIPLPNGKLLKLVSSSRTTVNATAISNLAKKLGASDSQIASCMKTSTFPVLRQVNKK